MLGCEVGDSVEPSHPSNNSSTTRSNLIDASQNFVVTIFISNLFTSILFLSFPNNSILGICCCCCCMDPATADTSS